MTELQQKKLNDGREYRNMTMTVRASDDGMVVEGYATTFNQPYELYSYGNYKVLEQVDANAFDDCDMSDVIFQYNHQGRVFARTRNGTLTVTPDETGLKVEADLSGTEAGQQLFEEIKGGYTDRMSFGFIVGESEKTYIENSEEGTETVLRTIKKITKLYDVSAVSIPANDMTSISARNFGEGVISELEAERRQAEAKMRLAIKLKLEV